MMPLAAADRGRLARILGMLGSSHAGERDAAALAADRLVRGRGLAWQDVLGGGEVPSAGRFQPSPNPSPSPYGDHLADLMACGQRLDLLTAWEREFIASLASRRKISSRQREILAEVAAKVRAAGPRRG